MHKMIVVSFLILNLLFCLSLFFKPNYGLRYNFSSSLPHRLLISRKIKNEPLTYGQIVSFHHANSPLPLAKLIAGLPGDKIEIKSDKLFVNNQFFGNLKKNTSEGKPLTPLLCGCIPPGYAFVYGSHELSYDSRYAEFGLIDIKSIEEILCPLF